jgi:hypothetical protein
MRIPSIVRGWRTPVLALFAIMATPAHAVPILDTGIPSGTTFQTTSTRAAQFTLSGSATIQAVSSWQQVTAGGLAFYRLYGDNAGLPGTQLFSTSITLQPTGSIVWVGPTGLNWSVGPGTYWVSFEATGQTTRVRRPLSDTDPATLPPNPAALEASKFGADAFDPSAPWLQAGARTGWRVEGVLAQSVPEPGTVGLFAVGLMGLASAMRRRRA